MKTNFPQHIAFIMDGNGRWAQQRKLARTAGHREGAKRVQELIQVAKKKGIAVVTFFAFSTENWVRPKSEINFLFKYLVTFLNRHVDTLHKNNVRVKFIGRHDRLPTAVVSKIDEFEKMTEDNTELTVILALDYGGRWDIVQATKRIVNDVQIGKVVEQAITEELFNDYLSLAKFDDPDLLIRTSGELRISNFLLWNLAYTEFYFTPVYWPEFTEVEFNKAISEYCQRKRRYGNI